MTDSPQFEFCEHPVIFCSEVKSVRFEKIMDRLTTEIVLIYFCTDSNGDERQITHLFQNDGIWYFGLGKIEQAAKEENREMIERGITLNKEHSFADIFDRIG